MIHNMTKLRLKTLQAISKGRNICLLQLSRDTGISPLTVYQSRDFLIGLGFITMEPKPKTKCQLVAKITKRGSEYLQNDKD